MSVLAALAAGLLFALAAALQHRAAGLEDPAGIADPRLLARLVRRPMWLVANLCDVGGIGLQALALRLGTLVTVQPLLLSGLLLALPAEAVLHGRPVRRREVLAVLLGGLGLTGFVLAVVPAAGIDRPSAASWLWVGVSCALAVAALLGIASRQGGTRRALLLGLATGVLYGVTAALLKTVTSFAGHPLGLLTHPETWALVLVGAAGLLLNQNAFQGASLAPGLMALSVTEPVTAVLIGVTAFHEQVALTPVGTVATLAALSAVVLALTLLSPPDRQPAPTGGACP